MMDTSSYANVLFRRQKNIVFVILFVFIILLMIVAWTGHKRVGTFNVWEEEGHQSS